MWLGLSVWTLVCILMFFYGITVHDYNLATLAVFIYAAGWILRWWLGTGKETSPEVIYVRKK